MRSGKYFFTSGGTRMFPIPTPAKISADVSSSGTAPKETPRSTSPAAMMTSATAVTRSMPNRRSNSGVASPKIAKHTGGAVPMSPTIAVGTAKSAAT